MTEATSDNVAGLDEPFNVAVTVAVWSETSAPVLAVNVTEVALAATLTEDGTVNWDGALLESVTTVLLVAGGSCHLTEGLSKGLALQEGV